MKVEFSNTLANQVPPKLYFIQPVDSEILGNGHTGGWLAVLAVAELEMET